MKKFIEIFEEISCLIVSFLIAAIIATFAVLFMVWVIFKVAPLIGL